MSKYIPSSASNNTSLTKVANGPSNRNNNYLTSSASTSNSNPNSSYKNHKVFDLDEDFDSALCPPALSPFALSILDDKLGDRYKNSRESGSHRKIEKRDHNKLHTNSTLNSISTNEFTNPKNQNLTNTTVTRHSTFMRKLGLGAPKRLTINGDFQSTGNSQLPDDHSESPNTGTNFKDIKRKHSLQLTPNRYSPTHKKTSLPASSINDLSNKTSTPTKQNKLPNSIVNSHVPILESPEFGRKTKLNLSDSKPNGGIIDIFRDDKPFVLNLDSKSNKENINPSNDFDHIQSLAEKKKEIYQLKKELQEYKDELDKQKKMKNEKQPDNNRDNNNVENNNMNSNQKITINKRTYNLLEQIGKGGSSKVYRCSIIDSPKRFFAIKIVNLEDHESSTIQELKGEIKILHKLRHCNRVVRLLDYSLTSKNIYFVMECGNLDLATVLSNRHTLKKFYDLEFIRYHSQEMIKCIDTIHQLDVVHLDLKPANFVFVNGILKLIDFGISNSIKGHTVNVYREFQMGTPNYMAPETLIDCAENENGSSIWKVGKPADVWSLGCILYQLTYAMTPYASYTGTKKILAITNPSININYPSNAVNLRKKPEERDNEDELERVCPYLIDMIKKCLIRDPSRRITSQELLGHPFINPVIIDKSVIKEVVRGCVGFGGRHPELKKIALSTSHTDENSTKEDKRAQERLDRLIEGVWKRVSGEKVE
ncbi:uncharacterized protein C5L36_0E01310 [Pichia kudriavzevii]|uniref:Protein kinase domain-containing protein n=1 Tax=Pichia kudriavzevii TaxID=4909 RepID=A0A2U9RB52_PICKU|nr:uncharacterized protein C5L36_0E01310 [Pichia kudriavzevii]AWU78069.1 hypothetical protein C5L36_0E01310 [Pichia kudriavzevii]